MEVTQKQSSKTFTDGNGSATEITSGLVAENELHVIDFVINISSNNKHLI